MECKQKGHQVIVEEIKYILKEMDVRMDDNFTDLGGNSIMAMIITDNLQKKHSIKIELAQLLGSKIGEIELKPLGK